MKKKQQLYGYFKWQTGEISWEDLDMVTEKKPLERNWIFSNSSAKQSHKNQLYSWKNR